MYYQAKSWSMWQEFFFIYIYNLYTRFSLWGILWFILFILNRNKQALKTKEKGSFDSVSLVLVFNLYLFSLSWVTKVNACVWLAYPHILYHLRKPTWLLTDNLQQRNLLDSTDNLQCGLSGYYKKWHFIHTVNTSGGLVPLVSSRQQPQGEESKIAWHQRLRMRGVWGICSGMWTSKTFYSILSWAQRDRPYFVSSKEFLECQST